MAKRVSENLELCNSVKEIVGSDDFIRLFEKVVSVFDPYSEEHGVSYDLEEVLMIINKIKNKEGLKSSEKMLMSNLIKNRGFREIAERTYNRVRGFTLEDSQKFLDQYPLEDILDGLRKQISYDLIDNLDKDITIVDELRYKDKVYLKARMGEKETWTQPGVVLSEEDFLYDFVNFLHVRDGKLLYQATLGRKTDWLEFGEKREEQDFVLDEIGPTELIGKRIFYKAKIGNKWSYLELGEEMKRADFLFDELGFIRGFHTGNIIYEVKMGNELAYIEFGEELTPKTFKRFSSKIEQPFEKNGQICYKYSNSIGIKRTYTFEAPAHLQE